jgi:hypothetical protein
MMALEGANIFQALRSLPVRGELPTWAECRGFLRY